MKWRIRANFAVFASIWSFVETINFLDLLISAVFVSILVVMFFRRKRTPSGQVLQLVESYRNHEGISWQRVIVSLGNASLPQRLESKVAQCVEMRLCGSNELFGAEEDDEERHWIDYILRRIDAKPEEAQKKVGQKKVIGIIVDKVEHGVTTELGPELVGLHAWQELGIPGILRGLGFNRVQVATAAVSVINRLVDSVSEHRLSEWVRQSSLPELIGEEVFRDGDDGYYRMSDMLLRNQAVIEKHLRQRQGQLFRLDRTVVLYDLTNTHFEGVCRDNPKAKRGHNKQKRNDCPQVVVGMVFDGDGFELAHRVFEGNKSDSKSLIDMVKDLESAVMSDDGQSNVAMAKPLVIVDAGVATAGNLVLLREKGFSYLVNDSRRGRTRYAEEFAHVKDFEQIQDRGKRAAVLVRRIEEEHDGKKDCGGEKLRETLVLCRSAARGEKERAIVSNAEQRFRNALEKLRLRINEGKLRDGMKVQRSVGRILSGHTRVARYYDVKTAMNGEQARTISWRRKDEQFSSAEQLYGCYVLRTDRTDMTAQQVWSLYMTLTRAEDGFHALKGCLGLRPNRHQKEWRVDGHIFISVLAFQLLCYIMRKLELTGDTRNWESIRQLLQTHSYTTVIMPTEKGEVYRLRKAGIPEECQKKIYANLGIDWKVLPRSQSVFKQKKTESIL
jgi:transposase